MLVDSAENPEDIDKNRAEAARIRAEERLQHKQSMHEYYQSKIALDLSLIHIWSTTRKTTRSASTPINRRTSAASRSLRTWTCCAPQAPLPLSLIHI